jgi:putative peptide zinc metalloprotease protein
MEEAGGPSQAERIALLRGTPAFAPLPDEVLVALAASLVEERFAAGETVIVEGEAGDRLYLVVQGRAEATTSGALGHVPLAIYQRGAVFGELALLTSNQVRRASVTADTDLAVLSLQRETFEQLLDAYPESRDAFQRVEEKLLIMRFLQQASPFATTDLDCLDKLATRLEPLTLPEGKDVIRQGDAGDACYLLRSGKFTVLARNEDGAERELATLRPGAIVGEAALLTDAPRNATVRAAEPCELLALRRSDFLEVVTSDRRVGQGLLEMIRLRDRPRQAEGIVVAQRTTADGAVVTTLKDPHRAVYYRLSSEGYFVWQRLDGQHTLRDLALELMTTFNSFSPEAINHVIQDLAASGFLKTQSLRHEAEGIVPKGRSTRQRLVTIARRSIDWQVSLPNPDPWLTRLYRGGVRLLFTRPAQILLAVLATAGLVVFVANLGKAEQASIHGGWVLLLFFVIWLVSVVLHELGHAFTVKACGREVLRWGAGWYWFAPIAYVDTSDMWLAGRGPRILVTLGGPYASVLVAGTAAILASSLGTSVAALILWQLAFISFYAVLINLNPLLELDGYYIVMDWLDYPNLREHSLAWLGNELPKALGHRDELVRHRRELLFGVGVLLYVAFSAFMLLIVYRLVIEGWSDRLMPAAAASALAWLLTGALLASMFVSVASDLRGSLR